MSHTLADLDAGLDIDSVVQRDHQGLREVQKAHPGAAVSPLPGDSHFDAADGTVVVCILRLDALFDEGGNDDFVVVERRHTKSQAHDFDGLAHKVIRQILMIAHRQVWLSEARLCDAAQDQEAHRIDRVLPIRRLAAHGDVLIERAAPQKSGCGSRNGSY